MLESFLFQLFALRSMRASTAEGCDHFEANSVGLAEMNSRRPANRLVLQIRARCGSREGVADMSREVRTASRAQAFR
jgi:hypothetical protein